MIFFGLFIYFKLNILNMYKRNLQIYSLPSLMDKLSKTKKVPMLRKGILDYSQSHSLL